MGDPQNAWRLMWTRCHMINWDDVRQRAREEARNATLHLAVVVAAKWTIWERLRLTPQEAIMRALCHVATRMRAVLSFLTSYPERKNLTFCNEVLRVAPAARPAPGPPALQYVRCLLLCA